jgi:protein CpxP
MEKSKFLKVIIIFLLVLNLGTLIFLFLGRKHGGHHPHEKGNHEGPANFIIEELKFDEKQQVQFEDLKKEHQNQMRSMEDSMRTQRDLLPDVIIAGDDSKADSIASNISRYQKQIEIYTYQHFVKVFRMCNDEQKKKFKNIIDDILKMMGPKKGGPPHRR